MSAWSDADRELVAEAMVIFKDAEITWAEFAAENPTAAWFTRAGAGQALDALTAAGWEPRCDCDGVAHDRPILRSHIRGEPGCKAASSDEGSTDG